MSNNTNHHSYLADYVKSLVELHRLVVAGKDKGSEGDDLRDHMDEPWYRMTDNETELTNVLAADLYRFDDAQPPSDVGATRLLVDMRLLELAGLRDSREAAVARQAYDNSCSALSETEKRRIAGLERDLRLLGVAHEGSPAVSSDAEQTIQRAIDARDWDAALSSLRDREEELPLVELATLRAICWANIGRHEVASWFFGIALHQARDNVVLESLYLRSLVRAEQFDRAKLQARCLVQSSSDPFRLLVSADVLLQSIVHADEGQASTTELNEVVRIVERVPPDSLTNSSDASLWQIAATGYLSAAWAYELLGDRNRAEIMYRTAKLVYDRGEQAMKEPPRHFAPALVATIRQQRETVDLNLLTTVPSFVLP